MTETDVDLAAALADVERLKQRDAERDRIEAEKLNRPPQRIPKRNQWQVEFEDALIAPSSAGWRDWWTRNQAQRNEQEAKNASTVAKLDQKGAALDAEIAAKETEIRDLRERKRVLAFDYPRVVDLPRPQPKARERVSALPTRLRGRR